MFEDLKALLRGDVELIAGALKTSTGRSFAGYCSIILIGSALYGSTLGIWRAPLQASYTAIKFPSLIFLTCAGNAVLNGMLAQLLGSGLTFKQTSMAILMSFAI